MSLDDVLERWAYWLINNGVASSIELSKLINRAETVTPGETSVKPKPSELVCNDIEIMIHSVICESLTKSQQFALLYNYKILALMPDFMSESHDCGILLIDKNIVSSNLYRAKQKLRVLTMF